MTAPQASPSVSFARLFVVLLVIAVLAALFYYFYPSMMEASAREESHLRSPSLSSAVRNFIQDAQWMP